MSRGMGLKISPPSTESFLSYRGISEAKLLNVPPLASLPDDAWRIMWEGLAQVMWSAVSDFFVAWPSCTLPDIPIQFAPGWYWGTITPSMSVWRIGNGGDEYLFMAEDATINKLLNDLHLIPWRVWHTICNIESMREYWRGDGSKPFSSPKQEKLTSLEAYYKIKGWLVFQHMKEE